MPTITPEFMTRMEDLLELYAHADDPKEPVRCCDEKSKQLLQDRRQGASTKPGTPRRQDDAYERNGVRKIFLTVEPTGGFRTTTVTQHRKKPDVARAIERLVTLPRYRKAKRLPIVRDHLNTHVETSLIETFGSDKTKRMMHRLRFHDTPKHASWLKMAEIERSIMGRPGVNRSIPAESTLVSAAASWEQRRHTQGTTITWRVTKQDARKIFKYDKTGNYVHGVLAYDDPIHRTIPSWGE